MRRFRFARCFLAAQFVISFVHPRPLAACGIQTLQTPMSANILQSIGNTSLVTLDSSCSRGLRPDLRQGGMGESHWKHERPNGAWP